MWSGDTESSWKTLEAQIAVGINYSLSIGPSWGSDIGGFYPNNELTGELYVRWHQFAAFCGSFRSHGRTWFTRLPWGWGLSDMGPREYSNTNAPIPPDDRRNILQSEMNDPAIEPIAESPRSCATSSCPTPTHWRERRGSRPAADARDVAALSRRRARARSRQSVHVGTRPTGRAGLHEGGVVSRRLPAKRRVVRLVDERARHRRASVARAVDLATMPIYVRAGAIIPVDPVRQYTSEPVAEPTTLRVYRGADGQFTLYEDDGISQDYLKAKGSWTRIVWNDREGSSRSSRARHPARPTSSLSARSRCRCSLTVRPGGDLFRKAGPVEVLMRFRSSLAIAAAEKAASGPGCRNHAVHAQHLEEVRHLGADVWKARHRARSEHVRRDEQPHLSRPGHRPPRESRRSPFPG